MPEKLATCCYCGRRAALRLADHSLVCGSCGAPLRDMKPLRPKQAKAAASHAAPQQPKKIKKSKSTSKKKHKSLWKKVFDEIEDIFD